MDVIELLKRQHEEVRDVLERMISEDDAKESRALLGQVSSAMRLHMLIEEKIVYPAAIRAFEGDEDDEETVVEFFEEHAVARRCLEELESTTPNDKRFVVRTKILKKIFESHVEEEENEMFPELEGKLGEDGMRKVGDLVERRMHDLEAETGRNRGTPRARRGQGAGRARAARTGRAASTRTGRRAGGGARGRGAKARRVARKGTRGAKSTARTSSSRESNGNKPRRGEG